MMAPAPSASRPRPVPREDTSPLWGSRGRVATRSGSRNRARERVQGRRGVGDRELNEGLADPWARHQMVLSQLDGLRQRRWAVALDPFGRRPQQPSDELFQDHQIDDCLNVANFGHQPLAAGVSELLGHHKGPTVIPQLHRAEALTMLFGGTADALKDGPLEIVVGQEACYQQLLCCHLCLPRQQRDQTHRPLGARPATRLRCFLKEVHERLRVVLWTHLHQRDVGDGGGCDGAPEDLPVFILRLDQQAEPILLFQLEVHQRLVLRLVKTSKSLHKLRKWRGLSWLHGGVSSSSSRVSAPM